MTQPDHSETINDFYDTHPINETQILQTLQKEGIPLETEKSMNLALHDFTSPSSESRCGTYGGAMPCVRLPSIIWRTMAEPSATSTA